MTIVRAPPPGAIFTTVDGLELNSCVRVRLPHVGTGEVSKRRPSSLNLSAVMLQATGTSLCQAKRPYSHGVE